MRVNAFLRHGIAALLMGMAAISAAAECTSEDDNLVCLLTELQEADGLLKLKVQSLVAKARRHEQAGTSEDFVKAMRAKMVAAILDADKAWRVTTKAECNTLVLYSYGNGTGGENGAARCALQRTEERIQFLIRNESYQWLQ
ncbi:lysozyme inhibitor LprI family protein [Roseateles chitinivorans]|uniref:lysozyme inhibitor LprI family protein n=1 Tax=Roseateles chitinivorans TaxID=2917965 RepID=UPI003D66B61C